MRSSSESHGAAPPANRSALRGEEAAALTVAQLDTDLRDSPYAVRYGRDMRLADPRLEAALAHAHEQVRRAATAQGYAQGHALGLRAARATAEEAVAREAEQTAAARSRAAAELEEVLGTVRRAAAALEVRTLPVIAEVEELVLETALELATILLGRELATSEDPGVDAVRRALGAVPRDQPVTVRLNPADHASLERFALDSVPAAAGRSVELVADPTVERGGAVADCGAAHVDAQVASAVDRVREVLAP